MSQPHLTLKPDGKLYCVDIPDAPSPAMGSNRIDRKAWDKYDKSKAEAIANALEVVNPEDVGCFGRFKTTFYHYYGKMTVGDLYPWYGGADRIISNEVGEVKEVVRLSLPETKDSEPVFTPEVVAQINKELELAELRKENEQLKTENGIYFNERNEAWKENAELIEILKGIKEMFPGYINHVIDVAISKHENK